MITTFIGTSWTIQAQTDHMGRVRGYATEAQSARTHRFIRCRNTITGRNRVAELFEMRPLVPNYVRLAVGKLMRQITKGGAE